MRFLLALPTRFAVVASTLTLGIGCAASVPSTPVTPVTPSTTSALSEAEAGKFEWSKPQGWKAETIPFPLGFAPELPYRGVEEIRFGPRFFDSTADTYFSYSFAWLLDGTPAITATQLGADLAVYFKGLAHAVDAVRFDPTAHSAHVVMADATHYRGRVTTVDAFGDGRALELNMDGETFLCGARRVVLLTLSPHPASDPTWDTLKKQRATFQCGAKHAG